MKLKPISMHIQRDIERPRKMPFSLKSMVGFMKKVNIDGLGVELHLKLTHLMQ